MKKSVNDSGEWKYFITYVLYQGNSMSVSVSLYFIDRVVSFSQSFVLYVCLGDGPVPSLRRIDRVDLITM